MSANNDETERLQRYELVVAVAVAQPEFSLADIKQACQALKPVFVTRVVRELEKDGHLRREGPKARPSFRWIRDPSEFVPGPWITSKVFNNRMTRAPLEDRPRERLLAEGAASLRTADLLAILIRSGRPGESVSQAGEKIAACYSGQLEELPDAGRGELKAISPAVADTAYCQIMAGIELGRRVADAMKDRRQPICIKTPHDAAQFCRDRFARLASDGTQEEFRIVTLDTKHQVINTHQVSVGLLDHTVVHPREIFRPAIKDAAKSVILVHNHPSGDPTPSEEDRTLTERLTEAGRTLGISVLDHIIVARGGTVSIRDGKKFQNEMSQEET